MREQITGQPMGADNDADGPADKIPAPDPAMPVETDADTGGAARRYRAERWDLSKDHRGHWDALWLYGAAIAGLGIVVVLIVRLVA